MASEADKIAYGEIRSWAIKSQKDHAAPKGLADAKVSMHAVAKRNKASKDVHRVDGSKATAKADKAAWKNIVEAKGGSDKSKGAAYFCVGHQKCRIVTTCSYWDGTRSTKKKRAKPLKPVNTVNVGSNTLYFYKDEWKGWCDKAEYLGTTKGKKKKKK